MFKRLGDVVDLNVMSNHGVSLDRVGSIKQHADVACVVSVLGVADEGEQRSDRLRCRAAQHFAGFLQDRALNARVAHQSIRNSLERDGRRVWLAKAGDVDTGINRHNAPLVMNGSCVGWGFRYRVTAVTVSFERMGYLQQQD